MVRWGPAITGLLDRLAVEFGTFPPIADGEFGRLLSSSE